MADKTEVFNRALIKLGVPTITSPEDPVEQARKCKQVFGTVVLSELRKNPWSFASARQALPVLADAPAFGWKYAYQLPSDFVRLIQVGEYYDFAQIRSATDQELVPYTIEGRKILTDYGAPLNIRYIRDVSEEIGEWDALFVEAVACRVALEVGETLTKSQTKVMNMAKWYTDTLAEAKRVNAIERPPVPLADNSWITTRL